MLLGITMVFIPIIGFRSRVIRRITFDLDAQQIHYSAGFNYGTRSKSFVEVAGVNKYAHDRSSYTTAFDDSKREYQVDFFIQWTNKKEDELFHFKSRMPEQLVFTKQLGEQLNAFMDGIAEAGKSGKISIE